jgi:hypothetical protein
MRSNVFQITRNGLLIILVVVGVLLLGLSSLKVVELANRNLALVLLYNALWRENLSCETRYKSLEHVARLLDLSVGDNVECLVDNNWSSSDTMIRSLLAAEYYRRKGEYNEVGMLLRCATSSFPDACVSDTIMVPGWAVLKSDGAIVIDGAAYGWSVRQDTVPEAMITRGQYNEGVFSSVVRDQESKRAVFAWNRGLDISNHHTILMKAVVQQDCRLSVKAVVDGQNKQYLQYDGTGQKILSSFTLQGDQLDYIYVRLDYTGTMIPAECNVIVESLVFLLDKNTRR